MKLHDAAWLRLKGWRSNRVSPRGRRSWSPSVLTGRKRERALVALSVGVSILGLTLLVLDLERQPRQQLLGSLYQKSIRIYQTVGRPLLRGRVRCRFRPSCSEYSIEAVRRHGLVAGVAMTIHRLQGCRPSVPLGTTDAVP
jgi:putative membrane protein insertion efficiency factor